MTAGVLVVAAAVALGGGLRAGRRGHDERPSGHRGSAPAKAGRARGRAARRPSLQRQVGQLLVMSYDGPVAPPYILRRLRTGQGTGVILFAKNAPDAPSVTTQTTRLQAAARGGALVATDQEGGNIRSLAFAPPVPSEGRQSSAAEAETSADAAARGLKAVGVNVNLAPVADVAGSGSVIAGRAFPGGAGQVAASTAAAIGAYGRRRVACTAKHFPGLGRATANTDDAPVTVTGSRPQLMGSDIAPFRAAIRAGTPLVMASHALYPAFDRNRIASQSPAILQRLLRGRLGFRGAVVTDSIEAQAVLDRSDVATAAQRSVEGGADLVLMTGSGSFNLVQPAMVARARRDRRFRAKVNAAADRVVALKRRLGLALPGR